MNMMSAPPASDKKFAHPGVTAKGERRAQVALRKLDTLWFNTGTLCNVACEHCYIESSPSNDRLVYLTHEEMCAYLDEIARDGLGTREIGFTGGEPFMNPDMPSMLETALARGFEVLVLTNAMQPMMRPKIREKLLAIQNAYGEKLTMRVSLDHYSEKLHDEERGPGAFAKGIEGLSWLSDNGFTINVAGRTLWHEEEKDVRDGFAALFARENIAIDAQDPAGLVLFPEMDEEADVPEITTACWGILNVDPADMMCASSRMVVKRKGAEKPAVLACTLLPYDARFELGTTLKEASSSVPLNHPHCARFCVLGGGSCSG
ncbi:radical SAM domain protein [Tepidicaulis marinus]|uniref:Radical SAM domain protein n=1 Tax=Tepidicaulis marinus TaxID=1333998 RepID=A0A081BBY9_9HYPH|nr:radical SAM protein [Tepidicaulis marinus]GAK45557.1 radical SAM domain protein [Tepidicaulis marinus]